MQSFQPEASEPSLVGWASTARPLRIEALFRWTTRDAAAKAPAQQAGRDRPGRDAAVLPLRPMR